MDDLKEQLQQDIISYFDGYIEPPWVFTIDDRPELCRYPPFVFTEEDKETMEDELCNIVVFHIQEANNG